MQEEKDTESPEYSEHYSMVLDEMDRMLERAAIAVNLLKMKQPWINTNQAMALYINTFASMFRR